MSGLSEVDSALCVLEESVSASDKAPRLFSDLITKLRKVQSKWPKVTGAKQEKLRSAATKLVCTAYHNVGIMRFNNGNYASCVPLLKLASPMHASLEKRHQCQLLAARGMLALSLQFGQYGSTNIDGEAEKSTKQQHVAYIEDAITLLHGSMECLKKRESPDDSGAATSQLLASLTLEMAIARSRLAFLKTSIESQHGSAFELAISTWSEVLAGQNLDGVPVGEKENANSKQPFLCQADRDTHQFKWAKHAWQYLMAIADQLALMQVPALEVLLF